MAFDPITFPTGPWSIEAAASDSRANARGGVLGQLRGKQLERHLAPRRILFGEVVSHPASNSKDSTR
jgi:hypothetical protein